MEKLIRMGTVTGRCTHHSPNLAQCVSSQASEYGKEFRSLFIAPTDMVMCGIDLGLELRVLGHYLHNYDNGEFFKTLLEDDIHTANQKATGLPTRDKAKLYICFHLRLRR